MFKAKVVLDSIGPNDKRLISVEATYPRFIHSELLTHRDRERNSASSRAISWRKARKDDGNMNGKVAYDFDGIALTENCMMGMIISDPVIPIYLGKEQVGMQSGEELSGADREETVKDIIEMRDFCLKVCDRMAKRGLHKSIVNRYVEPWMWITVLMTATEWKNFFRLRCHPDAEKHFQKIAGMIRDEIEKSVPQRLKAGEWHLPYINDEDWLYNNFHELDGESITDKMKLVSAGRCARLSYLTHDGRRDLREDSKLAQRLIVRTDDVIHASPLGHVGEASDDPLLRSGPFRGWKQFRKEFANENVEG